VFPLCSHGTESADSGCVLSHIGSTAMLVELDDGQCRSCESQLEVVGADDATLEVECTECGDCYVVEPDAFNDGAIKYWPEAMVGFGEDL